MWPCAVRSAQASSVSSSSRLEPGIVMGSCSPATARIRSATPAQKLADHALASTVNFPVTYSVAALSALESLALVTAAALAILAIPGYLAASVPAAVALQD
jgi:hypothetical protein